MRQTNSSRLVIINFPIAKSLARSVPQISKTQYVHSMSVFYNNNVNGTRFFSLMLRKHQKINLRCNGSPKISYEKLKGCTLTLILTKYNPNPNFQRMISSPVVQNNDLVVMYFCQSHECILSYETMLLPLFVVFYSPFYQKFLYWIDNHYTYFFDLA